MALLLLDRVYMFLKKIIRKRKKQLSIEIYPKKMVLKPKVARPLMDACTRLANKVPLMYEGKLFILESSGRYNCIVRVSSVNEIFFQKKE